jgi:hypothetical protein
LETPLKFRAPDVTLRIGLGIGRLVFRALNAVEAALALALLATFLFGSPPARAVIPAIVTAAVLVVQIVVVRPRLSRRSGRILAGEDAPRSRSHYAYVILETLKVAGLITTGALLVAS